MAKKHAKDPKKGLPLVIGIDFGGTGIKGGIVDLRKGKMVGDRFRIDTPKPATPEAVAETVEKIVAELVSRDAGTTDTTPVGMTFPGIVKHGVAHSAANIDKSWLEVDIDKLITDRLGRSVHVINDADAAGLAEARYGAGKGIPGSVMVITLGTGIGSAMIFNSQLVPNFELGHLEIDGFDAESKASAVAREREELSWDEYAVRLQRYFSTVEFLFSPDLFIVGGGISKRSEDFLPKLELKTKIIPAELRNNAGIVGAALEVAISEGLTE